MSGMTQTFRIAVLPGDGVGQEVTPQAVRALEAAGGREGLKFALSEALIGGIAYEKTGNSLPPATRELCLTGDAVLFGSVGGPVLDSLPRERRGSLLDLRRDMRLAVNLRPSVAWEPLMPASPLRPDVVRGADILFVRELAGGLYYGPGGHEVRDGVEVAWDTMLYAAPQVEHVARAAFTLARGRRRRVTSIDKSNVLHSSRLWRSVVTRVSGDFPEIELEHLIVDNASLQLIRAPRHFDVVVAENTFGDILSDELGALSGSLGMLPSASLAARGPGLFEPVHGSAPDIAGKSIANPLGAMLSAGMLLEHGLHHAESAARIRDAVAEVLAAGWRTVDLSAAGGTEVSTTRMGDLVVESIGDAK
jgi:3-isopropylmalate dehydrogenase